MKKTIASVLLLLTATLYLSSCGSTKDVAYFQNADSTLLSASKALYDARIMPKDMLTITVNTTDYIAAVPFNLLVRNTLGANGNISSGGGGSLQTYLVDNNGVIRFPVVGDLHVEGLTVRQCEDLIKSKIAPYMAADEKPVVTVRMSSFHVSVIGEVSRPGTFTVSTEKINVLEALAQAGDLTIYGKRDNVMLIREAANGEKSIHRMDLRDANLINSPYYYLQQNDIVYVEPNKTKARTSTISSSTTIWFSVVSTLVSCTSLIYNICDD